MTKWLLVKSDNEKIPEIMREIPDNGIITVGSEPSSTIALPDENVAAEQFVIVCEDDRMLLLCRVDGTAINGKELPQGFLHNLQIGDEITLGDFKIFVQEQSAESENFAPNDSFGVPAPSQTNGINGKISAYAAENPSSYEIQDEASQKSLKDILEGLRAEEKFYFLIENGSGEGRRVYVETEEMWLGWSAEGKCVLTGETAQIAAARAQIRKDWSGVVMYPLQTGNVWLNNEPLNEPHRLKNDDRLLLMSFETSKPCLKTLVKFHEPTALLVLDSILPKELPPPVSFEDRRKGENEFIAGQQTPDGQSAGIIPANAANLQNSSAISVKKLIFGYFSFAEIFIMAIGTLLTAAMIFLILEFF